MAGNNNNTAHGKKYTAAEKHFKGEEEKYQRRIRVLEANLTASETEKRQMVEKYNELKAMYDAKDALYQRLLEYSQLSETDLKVALERDKSMTVLTSLLKFADGRFF